MQQQPVTQRMCMKDFCVRLCSTDGVATVAFPLIHSHAVSCLVCPFRLRASIYDTNQRFTAENKAQIRCRVADVQADVFTAQQQQQQQKST